MSAATGTAAASGRPRVAGRVARWAPWVVLVGVAIGVLVIGTHRVTHPSLEARVQHVASEVRCPVCEGESAAQSSAPASVQIRDTIRRELQAGDSNSQILSGLVASYGPGILEKPQASGISLVVWVVPLLAVAGAIAGLAWAFARWRAKAAAPAPDDADRALVGNALGEPAPSTGSEVAAGDETGSGGHGGETP